MPKTKTEKLKLIFLIVAIVVAATVLACGTIFAWLVSSDDVSSNVNSAGVVGRCKVSFSVDNRHWTANFSDINLDKKMKCGYSTDIYIKLSNGDNIAYDSIDIYFGNPQFSSALGKESAYTLITESDNRSTYEKYYFGTQLGVTSIDGESLDQPAMLAHYDRGADKLSTDAVYFKKDLSIRANSERTIVVTLTFIDTGENQNIYQGVVDDPQKQQLTVGECSRSIVVEYKGA